MVLIFNELCLESLLPSISAEDQVKQLIEVVNVFEPYAFTNEAIKVQLEKDAFFYKSEFGQSLSQWENDGDWGNEIKSRWWSIIDSPQIKEDVINNEKYIAIEKATIPALNNRTCEGLKVAYLTYPQGTLAISFPMDIFEKETAIAVEFHYSDKKEAVKVKHISQDAHLQAHKTWLIENNVMLKTWRYNLTTLFPRLEKSLEICENWGNLKKEHQHTRDTEKLENIAIQVALLNGWLIDESVSKLNQGRLIFKSLDEKMYLSLDYQHAAFEVYDKNGTHQGEWEFTGKKKEGKEKKDKTGGHDIKVK